MTTRTLRAKKLEEWMKKGGMKSWNDVRLDLHSQGLKSIPSSIGNLLSLQQLDLFYNKITSIHPFWDWKLGQSDKCASRRRFDQIQWRCLVISFHPIFWGCKLSNWRTSCNSLFFFLVQYKVFLLFATVWWCLCEWEIRSHFAWVFTCYLWLSHSTSDWKSLNVKEKTYIDQSSCSLSKHFSKRRLN